MKKHDVTPVLDIFHQLNQIPRPSHHEEKAADFLCRFAEKLGLEYERDAQNCVVIRKPATPGHENAEPIVILNHMDMVCVSEPGKDFHPLTDSIEAYVEDGWMKARGTSLGADNGIGLSMALAILQDDTLVHGPIEVLTTTNEEDGMSGASALSPDFIRGRKVLNLDSEDYDTITIGAAGANLQHARMAFKREEVPEGYVFRKLQITGGRGGHSGVDINKNRMNANKLLVKFLFNRYVINDIRLVSINGGDASASIASSATAVIGVKEKDLPILENRFQEFSEENNKKFESSDPDIKFTLEPVEKPDSIIRLENGYNALIAIDLIPCGVLKMHEQLENTVMTSNNIGLVRTEDDALMLTLHTRSFSNEELEEWSKAFAIILVSEGFEIERIMNAPSWQENPDSPFLKLVDQTFQDTLHFSPRKVAMHFVLEAGYYVQKYPGIQIACIGPRIVEPHSTQERVEMSTIENIWQVVTELLERLA